MGVLCQQPACGRGRGASFAWGRAKGFGPTWDLNSQPPFAVPGAGALQAEPLVGAADHQPRPTRARSLKAAPAWLGSWGG